MKMGMNKEENRFSSVNVIKYLVEGELKKERHVKS